MKNLKVEKEFIRNGSESTLQMRVNSRFKYKDGEDFGSLYEFLEGLMIESGIISLSFSPLGSYRLGKTIDAEIVLSVRGLNCLEKLKIKYFKDLINVGYYDLLRVKGLGLATANEITDQAEKYGIILSEDMIFEKDLWS